MNYNSDRKWADTYLRKQLLILKNIYNLDTLHYKIGNFKEDTQWGTDVKLLIDKKIIKVGLRVRKFYSLQYSDITFRAHRNNGSQTEIDKLKKCIGNYILYTWLDADEKHIIKWVYVKINHQLIQYLTQKSIIYNRDNQTGFITLTFQEIKELCGMIG